MAKMTKRAKVLNLVDQMRKKDPNVRPGDVVKQIEKKADLGTAAARTYYYNALNQLKADEPKKVRVRKAPTARKAA